MQSNNISIRWIGHGLGLLAASMNRATVAMRGFGRLTPTRHRWGRGKSSVAAKVRPAGSKLARKAAKGKVGIR